MLQIVMAQGNPWNDFVLHHLRLISIF